MKKEDLTTVVYHFADGTKIVQQINKESFVNEKDRQKSSEEMHYMFQSTCIDKKAVSYTLNGDAENIKIVKEQHFTKEERKNAKRDYKEFKRLNPNEFNNSLNQFKQMVTDKFAFNTRPLRFNLVSLNC